MFVESHRDPTSIGCVNETFFLGWKKMKARLPKQKENKKNEVHCMYILPDQSINKAKNIICGNSEAPFS